MTHITQLRTALANRTAPLDLVISHEGLITASKFRFGENFAFGVIFEHPEGAIEIGEDYPTRREWLQLDTKEFEAMPVYEQRECASKAAKEYGENECPEHKLLNDWLDEEVESECYEPSGFLSEHLPGIDVFHALSDYERRRLGLWFGDIGGIASSAVMAAGVEASAGDLNAAIAVACLPYRVIEDQRR